MSNIKKTNLRDLNCKVCLRRLDKVQSSRILLDDIEDEEDSKNRLRIYNQHRIIYYPDSKETIKKGDHVCKPCHTNIYHNMPPKPTRFSRTSSLVGGDNSQTGSIAFDNSIETNFDSNSNTSNINLTNETNITNETDASTSISTNEANETNNLSNKIQLDITRGYSSHKKCVVCCISNSNKKMHLVPIEAILDTYIERGILLKIGCRCCSSHLTDCKKFNSESLHQLKSVGEGIELDSKNVLNIFQEFRIIAKRTHFWAKFKNDNSFTDEESRKNTGLSKEDLIYLNNQLVSMRNSDERSKLQALTTYLFWIKTGLDQDTIGIHFEISQQQVSRYCEQARAALLKDFVQKNLGVYHLSRNEWIRHNSVIASKLFIQNSVQKQQLIVVADGTYLFCQKSSNNTFQRKTYSQQKKTHLVKPFVVCATDGYIIDIFGLHEANKNDARILLELLENRDDFRSLIFPQDIFLLDRGFFDAKETLETKYSVNVKIPSCIPPSQSQLTTAQANQTRFVTKCRFVVEIVNGFLKSCFRALDKNVPNVSLRHYLSDFKIAAAIINKFHSRIFSDGENAELIADNMLANLNKENSLEKLIKDLNLERASQYNRIDIDDIVDFPILTIDDIKTKITLGSYQIKQALSYIAENFVSKGRYLVYMSKVNLDSDNIKIIMIRIQSRHINRKKYKVYIKYNSNTGSSDSIESWMCSCKIGKRTVGCCSHITAIVYYLSYGRYQEKQPNPSGIVCCFCIKII